MQNNQAFTLEVLNDHLIPIQSDQFDSKTVVTKEKLIEIKTESNEQKLTRSGKVELLEKKKVKTSLTGEHDMGNFDFLNLPLKDLVTEDVSMLKLSIPNITSLTPFYSDSK